MPTLLGLKFPTGYYGCSRCTTKGIYCENRVCFPELNAPLRSDKNFKDRTQPQHHHFTSLLEEILELLGVSQAPLDGMHLIYACVAQRILFWLNSDTINYKFRLSSAQIAIVNNSLDVAAMTRPTEFARPVKDIRLYKKFKCTQLREFLLYLSIVALKKVFTKLQYEHLLLLVIGIRLLSDERQFKQNNALAKSMLFEYVQILAKNYGNWRVIYSVHNLIHLADEVLIQNQPLDKFSMWEFETANAGLKEFTKRQGAYLEQCFNRTMEKYNHRFNNVIREIKYPMVKFEIGSEYAGNNTTKRFFSRVVLEKFMLDASCGNRWFLTTSGEVGRFEQAVLINEKIKIRSRFFKRKFNYFDRPLNSSLLHIFQCNENDLTNLFEIDVDQVDSKMFMIRDGETLVFISLL